MMECEPMEQCDSLACEMLAEDCHAEIDQQYELCADATPPRGRAPRSTL